jgi:hypothetical protein
MEVLLDKQIKQALNEGLPLITWGLTCGWPNRTELLQYARIGKEQSDELAHPKLEHEMEVLDHPEQDGQALACHIVGNKQFFVGCTSMF